MEAMALGSNINSMYGVKGGVFATSQRLPFTENLNVVSPGASLIHGNRV